MLQIPYVLVQAIVMTNITYWMVGFAGIAWKWAYFLLLYFLALSM